MTEILEKIDKLLENISKTQFVVRFVYRMKTQMLVRVARF
jgi:hypothetical protein